MDASALVVDHCPHFYTVQGYSANGIQSGSVRHKCKLRMSYQEGSDGSDKFLGDNPENSFSKRFHQSYWSKILEA